ncbi:MAG: shikimate dehydrogenase [Cardiobacteriaceae bacterium]|nr:shikimate dehydrogenase [Cardiobacteriaceae bacterium]
MNNTLDNKHINKTYRCAVIGNPIAHSRSPEIHAKFAENAGILLDYDKILAEDEVAFFTTVKEFFELGGTGLNITVPYKTAAFEIADIHSEYAKRAKAVNTLSFDGEKIIADNTDGRGLCKALKEYCNCELKDKRVLIIGAGGAARGVIYPLFEEGVSKIDIFNRNFQRAEILVQDEENNNIHALHAPDDEYDLIINATSTGLEKDTESANLFFNSISQSVIKPSTICYEMMYGKKTPFMLWAENNHCSKIFDGYSMLVGQAKISFDIWFSEIISKFYDLGASRFNIFR